ncbi:hypothetical protein [Medusavirus stheno T3]|uniref:Uncharacterized protein n=1 Tax=Medusavirus stheno T3 TaxID=3069717 RepID=A0A7S7YEI8_9VIRU|nr:hypothetical protein QKU73_gp146 [Acanthamoeba castellanii medusavirus]QPB44327.1 hypothetical protein [Medusavirus stheno T3]
MHASANKMTPEEPMSLKWCPNATTKSSQERYVASMYPSLRPKPERAAVLVREFLRRHRAASFYTFDLETIEKGEAIFRGGRETFYFDADGEPVPRKRMTDKFPVMVSYDNPFGLSAECRRFKDCPHEKSRNGERSCDFFSESYHPEIRLPLAHPILNREEPVRYFVWTESDFPRDEMVPYMTFRRA